MTNRFLDNLETINEAQSRKDFEASAKILSTHKKLLGPKAHAELVHAFASHHAGENKNFDMVRYHKAAGLEV